MGVTDGNGSAPSLQTGGESTEGPQPRPDQRKIGESMKGIGPIHGTALMEEVIQGEPLQSRIHADAERKNQDDEEKPLQKAPHSLSLGPGFLKKESPDPEEEHKDQGQNKHAGTRLGIDNGDGHEDDPQRNQQVDGEALF